MSEIHSPLPAEVPCPVCGTTGLVLVAVYTDPEDVPIEPGLTIRPQSQLVGYRLEPCEHQLSYWGWHRDADDRRVWTLVPL